MKTMLFGPIGRMQAIPYPESGMGWEFGADTEVTDLLSGGRHIYEAPTPFKSFGMQWKNGTANLQPIVDIFNKVYGPGPYYLTDPNFKSGNVLPARWASSYLLRHIVNGWCAPKAVASSTALAGEAVVFTNLGQFTDAGETLIVPAVPDEPFRLKVWGARTGIGSVRVYEQDGLDWELVATAIPVEGGSEEIVVNSTAVKLALFCPNGSTLTLDHINLNVGAGITDRKPGIGVGAVKFTSNLSGNIQTKAFDRIGLSLDLTEIE